MGERFINYEKHGVVETTLLKNTTCGHHYNLVADVDVDNGGVAKIGDYVSADIFKAEIPGIKDKIVLIQNVPKIYSEYTSKMQEESNYFIEAGEPIRGGEIVDTDRFSLSTEAFDADATPAVGQYVGVTGTGYKLTTLGTTKPTDRGFIGHIYAIAANGNYRIWVDRNATIEA